MSLFGIDMGSSSVKISAYSEEGKLLAVINHEIEPLHPQPGWWETNPENVWNAARSVLSELAVLDVVRFDPPKAIAISASGRENFPADEIGNPLGNTLMGADLRGQEFEKVPDGVISPEDWTISCGHPRERMDPVLRLMWWKKYHPEIIDKARSYPDWHGFLTQRLCGRNVSERSLIGRWAVYDIKSRTWSQERIAEYGIESHLLPEVLEWGEVIGEIHAGLARELGLPAGIKVVTGGHDLNCAGIGTGASRLGTACLISGSYENMLIPTEAYPNIELLSHGLSFTPHLGKIERSIYAICPTGNAVLNWARETVDMTIEQHTKYFDESVRLPSSVMALPYLSGAMLHWKDGRNLRGTILGLTLATKPSDLIQAFMESIAYDNLNTLALLQSEKICVDHVRATGGGTRSEWWMQLKSDVMGVPIEVASEPEPGTLGAALLAGVGAGVYSDLDEASIAFSGTSRTFEPDFARSKLHEERITKYNSAVPKLADDFYANW